jgi:hypothetical protein
MIDPGHNQLLVASLISAAAQSQACAQFPHPALLASRGAGGIGAGCVAAAPPPAPNYAVHAPQRQTHDSIIAFHYVCPLHLAHQLRMVLYLDNRASSGGSAKRKLGDVRAHYEAPPCPPATI